MLLASYPIELQSQNPFSPKGWAERLGPIEFAETCNQYNKSKVFEFYHRKA